MKKLKIVAFGDSLTAGSALSEGDKNWTDIIAERFSAEVVNSGIGGHNTAQGLERFNRDVLEHSPDIAIICFGMNDHVISSKSGVAAVSEEDFRENLTKMVEDCRKNEIRPVLVTPNAVMENFYFTRHPLSLYEKLGGANAVLKRYVDIIISVAKEKEVPFADIFEATKRRNLESLLRTPTHGGFADGVHPYGDGILLYAELIASAIENI